MTVIYNLLLCLIYPLLWLASRFHRRLRENFALRSRPPDFSAAHGKTHIWFHAASAGEFEQVRAVAIEMKRRHKNLFFFFSFFSDSAYRAKKTDSVPDLLFALPFDFPWRMRALVAQMRPAALLIGKYDAWPNQVRAAQSAGVPVYLVSATLPEKSLRHRWPLRSLLRGVYAPMRQIFAVNADHAVRLRKIAPLNVTVSGDTRFDAIQSRLTENAAKKAELAHLKKILQGKSVLVGGSTYATSEKMIVEFLAAKPAYKKRPFVAVLAPHHIREERILSLEQLCKANGLKSSRFSSRGKSAGSAKPDSGLEVLIIDSLGLLPYLYPFADVAYVGGGFEGSVHSVIEAAVAGVPIITGAAIANSAEALELKAAGLMATLVSAEARDFAALVENLCKNRIALGRKLQAYFRQRLGVSKEIVHTVMDDILNDSKGEIWHTHQL